MPKFYSNPNKHKEAIENNMTPTRKNKLVSWIFIFVLFFAIIMIGIFSRSCTMRVIQTDSRKLVDNVIFEIIAQNEIYVGNYIAYKINLSTNELKKVNVRSFSTYIVYKGKKVFEYPSKIYPGPDTVIAIVDKNKPKILFSNDSFPYYPSSEGTYTIIADSYINDKFVELRMNVKVLHKSPLNLSMNSFFFPDQNLSGSIYINNPYPKMRNFKVDYVKISVNGISRKKEIDYTFNIASADNVEIANIQDFSPSIFIDKVGMYPLTITSRINNRLEHLQYPVRIINRSSLSSSQNLSLDINVNKYSYSIDDQFWFNVFIVNDSQETKYFRINSCSAIIKYKDSIIRNINLPIERNVTLSSFERWKVFSSLNVWEDLKVMGPYTVIFKVEFSGKDNKEITAESKIKIK